MRTELDRILAYQGILLAAVLSSAGCFSSVKQKDASAPKGDTAASDTNQAGADVFNGSGGRVATDASGGGGTGGVPGSGGIYSTGGGGGTSGMRGSGGGPSTGGSAGSDGAVADAFAPDAPILNDGPDDPPSLANGSSCTANSQCANGHCADGVCCDVECGGQCQSCNEKASAGKCTVVQGDPRGARAACAGTGKCKGQCDGTNATACLMPGSSTVCQAAGCVNGSATAASTCNGSGTCVTPTPIACASSLCATDGSGVCAGSCTSTSCATGYYCNSTGSCAQKKPSGAGNTCSGGTECSSGHCSFEGTCCNSDCTGQCQSCNNSSGTCGRVTSGQPVGGRTACANAGTTCGGSCDGSSDTACHFPATEQACGTAACSADSTSTLTPACNGSGTCTSSTTSACGTSAYCSGGSCTPKGNGACTNNVQCTSGNCSAGLCCASGLTNSNGVCCASGLTGCGGQCVNTNTSSSYCGSCTNACTGNRTCSSGTCACSSGTTDCGASGCVNVNGSDSTHCGSCTNVCASNQTCSSGNCQCTLGAMVCGGCLGWDFESGTQYWVKDTDPNWPVYSGGAINGAQNPTTSTTTTYPGSTRSLQVGVNIDMNTINYASVAVPICQSGGTANLSGRTLTASVFLSGTSDFDPLAGMQAFAWSSVGSDSCIFMWGTDMKNGTWITKSCQLTSSQGDDSQSTHVALGIFNSGPAWSGTMYIDNVQIQ